LTGSGGLAEAEQSVGTILVTGRIIFVVVRREKRWLGIILQVTRDWQGLFMDYSWVIVDMVSGGVRGARWGRKEEDGKKMVELSSPFVVKLSAT